MPAMRTTSAPLCSLQSIGAPAPAFTHDPGLMPVVPLMPAPGPMTWAATYCLDTYDDGVYFLEEGYHALVPLPGENKLWHYRY